MVWVIEDSREGWSRAFLFALETWFAGESVHFDFSHIRPYGARLKQMGGRASGAESLQHLFADVEAIVRRAAGRQLTPLECHDICCMVAERIVMGGKRRSAMISFSDIDDEEMRHAKDFSRGPVPSYRFIANNSVAYTKKPDPVVFMNEWAAMAASGSGERGILNTMPCRLRGRPVIAPVRLPEGISVLATVPWSWPSQEPGGRF